MGVNETRGCVVTFWHHEWAAPAFQVYAGLLFGLPLAVTSFNRYSRLVEALGRRLCYYRSTSTMLQSKTGLRAGDRLNGLLVS